MKISEKEKQSVVKKLTAFIDQEGKVTRARILDETAKLYGLSEKEVANKSPNSKNGLLRSYIGTVLNDLVASGDVAKQNDEYFLTKDKFWGAVNVKNGSHGIFLTSGSFHPSAEKLLKSIPNCVGIDRERLYQLVLLTAYGIVKSASGCSFDELIFNS